MFEQQAPHLLENYELLTDLAGPGRKVAEEVRDGTISLDQTRKAYGVVLDKKTLELDEEETEKSAVKAVAVPRSRG